MGLRYFRGGVGFENFFRGGEKFSRRIVKFQVGLRFFREEFRIF